VDSAVTVGLDGLGGGVDLEQDYIYRKRIIVAKSTIKITGTYSHYQSLCYDIAGVSRLWIEGAGQGNLPNATDVYIYFMMDNIYADGLPLASDIATLEEYVNGNNPITDRVTAFAPTLIPIDISIKDLSSDT